MVGTYAVFTNLSFNSTCRAPDKDSVLWRTHSEIESAVLVAVVRGDSVAGRADGRSQA